MDKLNAAESFFVSIIIPTLNAAKDLDVCLESLAKQNYSHFEIIIIDGGSVDETMKIARRYTDKIYNNPAVDAESGKSIGINKANGDIIALVDADNVIATRDWLKRAIKPFKEHLDIWGVASPWLYRREDSLVNRYITLLKIADPLARSFHPRLLREDFHDYSVFTAKLHVPVIGANGFLWRKDIIKKINEYIPKFEEVNYVKKVMHNGYYRFAEIKYTGIYHHYCDSISNFIGKRRKIGTKYLNRKKNGVDTWLDNIHPFIFYLTVVYHVSIVGPFFEGIYNAIKYRKAEWLLHPVFCFITIYIYFITFCKNKLRS